MKLELHRRDWEDLAALDPYWSIVSDAAGKFGRWDQAAFLATGEREVEAILRTATDLGYPTQFGRAVDFGCGVGRLTRPLAKRFEGCYGVDISARMISLATTLNRDLSNSPRRGEAASFGVRLDDDGYGGETAHLIQSAYRLVG